MAESQLSSADQLLNVYSRLFESLSDLIAVVDRMYVYRMANPAYSQRYAKATDQIVGHTVAELMGDDVFRTIVMSPLNRCFAGQPVTYESWFSYPVLGPRYMEVQYFPLFGNRQVEYVVALARDITDRKRAQEALAQSEERYHTAADFTYDWESWLDPDGNYIYISPACERITGYAPDEFISDPDLFERIAHPADRALVAGHLNEELPGKLGIRHLDFRIITRDGDVRWISHFCQPVYGKDGSWRGWRASNRDITQRKQVEEALRESEERFRTVFEDGPLGLVIVGLDHSLLAANPAYCRMTGYNEQELSQIRVTEIVYPQDAKKVSEFERRFVGTDAPCPERLEVRHVRKNGEVFWGRIMVSMVHGPDGKPSHAIATVEDITEQKEAEQLREQYISFVSHDLRSPLSVVIGQASTLQQQLLRKGLERESERMGAIVQNCWRMNSMIEDLVETTRMESGQMRINKVPTDLAQLVTEIAGRVGTPEQAARIRVDCPDCLPQVLIDQERMERAFVNLITNALKYSPPDSPVILKVALEDGEALISVIDQGTGIRPEDLPWIFERFYRAVTKKKTEGLGLGLYITRLIAEAHGGRVWVESEVGKGSAFHLSLPLSERISRS